MVACDISIVEPPTFVNNKNTANERNTDSSHSYVAKEYCFNTALKVWRNSWTDSTPRMTSERMLGIDEGNRN